MPDESVETRLARLEEQSVADARALIIAATEVARRLMELNHAHALAEKTLETYVPREKYEAFEREVRTWQNGMDKDTAASRGARNANTIALGIIFSILTLLSHFWK
jgi:hypothetical protein